MSAANNAAGASNQQYEKTLESVQTKTTELKNSWDQFMMSIANSEQIKGAIDLLNTLVTGMNKLFDTFSAGNSSLKTTLVLLTSLQQFKGLKMGAAGLGFTSDNIVTSIKTAWQGRKGKKGEDEEGDGEEEEAGNSFKAKTDDAGDSFKTKVEDAANQVVQSWQQGTAEKNASELQGAQQESQAEQQGAEGEGELEVKGGQEAAKAFVEGVKTAGSLTGTQGWNYSGLSRTQQRNKQYAQWEAEGKIRPIKEVRYEQFENGGMLTEEDRKQHEEYIQSLQKDSEKIEEHTEKVGQNSGKTDENSVSQGQHTAKTDGDAQQEEKHKEAVDGQTGGTKDLEEAERRAAGQVNQNTSGTNPQNPIPPGGQGESTPTKGKVSASSVALTGLRAAMIGMGVAASFNELIETGLQNRYDTSEEQLTRLTNSIDDLSARQSDVNSRMSSFSKTRGDLAELNKNLKELTVGTTEWYSTLQQNNDQIDDLIEAYPDLENYVSIDQNGVKSISNEGWEYYKQSLKNDTENIAIQKQAMQIQKSQLEQSEEINKLMDTSTVTQSELDEGKDARKGWSMGAGAVAGGAAGIGLAIGQGAALGSFLPVIGTIVGAAAGQLVGLAVSYGMSATAEQEQKSGVDEAVLVSNMERISLGNDAVLSKLEELAKEQENGTDTDTYTNLESSVRQDMINQGYNSEAVDAILEGIKENGSNTVDAIYDQGQAYSERNSKQYQMGLQEARKRGLKGIEAQQYALEFQAGYEKGIDTHKNSNESYKVIMDKVESEKPEWRWQTDEYEGADAQKYAKEAYKYYQEQHGYDYLNGWFYKNGVEVEQGEIYVKDVIEEYQNYLAEIDYANATMEKVSKGDVNYANMLTTAKNEAVTLGSDQVTLGDIGKYRDALNNDVTSEIDRLNSQERKELLSKAQEGKFDYSDFELIRNNYKLSKYLNYQSRENLPKGYEKYHLDRDFKGNLLWQQQDSYMAGLKAIFADTVGDREIKINKFGMAKTLKEIDSLDQLNAWYEGLNSDEQKRINEQVQNSSMFNIDSDKLHQLLSEASAALPSLGEYFNVPEKTLNEIETTFSTQIENGATIGLDTAINYIQKRNKIKAIFGEKLGSEFTSIIENAINSGQLTGEAATWALNVLPEIDITSLDGFTKWYEANLEKIEKYTPALKELIPEMQQAYNQIMLIPGAISLLKLDETAEGVSKLAKSLSDLRNSVDDFIELSQEDVQTYVKRGLKREDFALTRSGNFIYLGDQKDLEKATSQSATDTYHLYDESQDFLRGITDKYNLSDNGTYDVATIFGHYYKYNQDYNKQAANEVTTFISELSEEGSELSANEIYNSKLRTFFGTDLAKEFGLDSKSINKNVMEQDENGTWVWKDTPEAEEFKNNFTHFVQFLNAIQGKTEKDIDTAVEVSTQQSLAFKTPDELQNYLMTTDEEVNSNAVNQTLKQMASEHEGLWEQIATQLESEGLDLNAEDDAKRKKAQIRAAKLIALQDKQTAYNSMQSTVQSQAADFKYFAQKGIATQEFTEAVSQVTNYAKQIGFDWSSDFVRSHAKELAAWAEGGTEAAEALSTILKDSVTEMVKKIDGGDKVDLEQLSTVLDGLNQDILDDIARFKNGGTITENTKTFLLNLMDTLGTNLDLIETTFAALGLSLNTYKLDHSPYDYEKVWAKYEFNGVEYNTRKEAEDQAIAAGESKGKVTLVQYGIDTRGDFVSGLNTEGDEGVKAQTETKGSWENSYDRQYNLLKKIEREQQNRNVLESEYNRLQKAGVKDSAQYAHNLEKRYNSLEKEKKQQQTLLQNRISERQQIISEYAGKTVDGNSISDYAWIDENGILQIDWGKIDKLEGEENLTEQQTKDRETLTKYVEELETVCKNIDETTNNINSKEEAQLELQQQQRQAQIEIFDQIQQGLIKERQDEIDRLSEINDSINTQNSELIESIRSSVDKARQERDNAKTAEELDEKRRRLAYLQLDTSGASDMQIKELQDEIEEQQQSYRDTLVDQKINELEEQNDFAADQRQTQIDILQNQLKQIQDNPNKETLKDIYEKGIDPEGGIRPNSELQRLLRLAAGYDEKTSEQGQEEVDREIQEKTAQASADLGGANGAKATSNGTKATSSGSNTSSSSSASLPFSERKSEFADEVASCGSSLAKDYGSQGDQVRNLQHALNDIIDAGLDVDGSFGDETDKAVRKFQQLSGLDKIDGHVGPDTRKQFGLHQYKTGGAAYETGLAWLDGTPSRPEYVLNAAETQNFFALRDILSESMRNGSFGTQKSGDVYYQIDLKVEGGISSDYDVDRIISKVKSEIVSSQRGRNVNAIALGR